MPGRNCGAPWTRSVVGPARSSSDPILQKASRLSRAAGSSNAPSHGPIATEDWQKIGSKPSPAPRHGYSSRTYSVSVDFWQGADIARKLSNQTLRFYEGLQIEQ
jgi:hypothetical protein